MGSKWVWLFVVLMFVSLKGWCSQGCWEQERLALLQIKKHFPAGSYFPDEWVEREENLDCCQWYGVECNNKTRRVIGLDLSYVNSEGKQWYLNASLFSPFQQLKQLDLSENSIAGFIKNEGLEKLSTLSNLEFLDLSLNRFNNSILSFPTGFSSLRRLYLAWNKLNGTIDLQGLSSLEYLGLSYNGLNNSILSSVRTLSSLKGLDLSHNSLTVPLDIQGLSNLEHLDLSYNSLKNMSIVLPSLEDLPSLKSLILCRVGWKGIVDLQKIDSFNNLVELDLSYNVIDKFDVPKGYKGLGKLETLYLQYITSTDANDLLQSLGSFPSLKKLDLSFSTFSGVVPNRELLNFTNLEDLSLDESFFHTSPLSGIGAFTLLKRLSMRNCEVNGRLNVEGFLNLRNMEHLFMDGTPLGNNFLQFIKPMISLQILSLPNCRIEDTLSGICELVHLRELYMSSNDLKGSLPGCFTNLTSLHWLDISFNQITGSLSLLKDLTSITMLQLSNNHFKIPISLEPFFNLSKLKAFNGENNQIYWEAESDFLTPKFQLNSIILSGYGDGRSLPKFLYHQHELDEVDLSHINLKGEFPSWLLENNTKLEVLNLINNSLSGPLQLPIDPHMHLKTLNIYMNFFNESIPIEIGAYLPRLTSLNISRNVFDGEIPSSFGDMNSLQSLDLSHNRLYGEIPKQLAMNCISLQFLVLSNNRLQGHIFFESFNLTNLLRLQLDGNQFVGEIPRSLSKCTFLIGLYLSDNHFSGQIPKWLGNLSSLVDIIMPNNLLIGPIPTELCQLKYLEVLDLSNNNISGSLPSCSNLVSIKQVHLSRNRLQGEQKDAFYYSVSLLTLDLSYNHLSGSIPKQIGKLSNLRYLILTTNSLEGELPIQLCQLNQLRLIDLSHNNFSGQIPPCLDNTTLHANDNNDAIAPYNSPNYAIAPYNSPNYGAEAPGPIVSAGDNGPSMGKEETIGFTTKDISYFYQGKVLTYMAGLDLSCNNLTGEIPYQIGNLTGIRALNLSHNNLIGIIPKTFSNLKQIESMDLSHNKLNGRIPPQLVELNALEVFTVAYNNLSGKTPKGVDQFMTFDNSSYEGNPLLCGWPLSKTCDVTSSTTLTPKASFTDGEDGNFIDMDVFYISFILTYIIVLLEIAIVLYFKPYWRKSWFYFIEIWMASCYYFVVEHLLNRYL